MPGNKRRLFGQNWEQLGTGIGSETGLVGWEVDKKKPPNTGGFSVGGYLALTRAIRATGFFFTIKSHITLKSKASALGVRLL